MMVSGKMIFLMVMENIIIILQMKTIQVIGNKVICMAKENILLKITQRILEIFSLI